MAVKGVFDMIRNRLRRAELYSSSAYWDAKAAEHEGDAVSMWPNNRLNALYHREQVAYFDRELSDVAGLELLDVGCGTGRLSRLFASRGARVTAFDFSAQSIAIARRGQTGDNPAYRVQSLFALDDVERYDILLCWGVVTIACKNRGELQTALANIRRAVKPGGQIFLLEPIHRGPLHRVLDLGLRQFLDDLQAAGLVVQEVRQLHFWPARIALAYFAWPQPITSPIYQLGQWALRLPGLRGLGDYKAIQAIKPAIDRTFGDDLKTKDSG